MNHRDVNRSLLERAVSILETDLASVQRTRHNTLSELIDKTEEYDEKIKFLVGLGLVSQSQQKRIMHPYREVQPDEGAKYGVRLSPNLSSSQKTSISAMLERYSSKTTELNRKIDELGMEQDEIMRSLIGLTILTPLQQTGNMDTAVLYANKPTDEVVLKMSVDLYFGTHGVFSLTDIPAAEKQGYVQRRRMTAPYRRSVSAVYLLENLSSIVTTADMLLHAAHWMQIQYDQGNPDVAAQRNTLRAILRLAEPHRTFYDNIREQ
jgi:hypothetical protein